MADRDWATFPWSAFIWFLGVSVLSFVTEWKAESLKEKEPEVFPKRRIAVLVYSFVIGVLNLSQMLMWVQLIDTFNLTVTSLLFFRFWAIEKGHKRTMARNMAILMTVFTVLSFLAAMADVGMG